MRRLICALALCVTLLGAGQTSRPVHDLKGSLVDDEKRPLVGVEIKLSFSDGFTARTLGLVKTDAKGAFVFPSVSLPDDVNARLLVLAVPRDLAMAHAEIFRRKLDVPVELVSRPATEITGRFSLPDGSPAKDVLIHLESMQFPEPNGFRYWWLPEKDSALDARTDAEGNFKIGRLPNDATLCMITAERKGFAEVRQQQHTDTPFTVELQPEARIVGRAFFASDHKPAPHMKIYTQGADKSQSQQVYTDEAGRYELIGLGADKYNIWIEAPNYTCEAIDSLQVSAGEKVDARDLELIKGGLIKGKVIDQETNQPICPGDDADVAIYGPSRPESGAAVETSPIQKDGTFSIRVAPGSNRIYIRPGPGWKAADSKVVQLSVDEDQTVTTDFTVRKMTEAELKQQESGGPTFD